VKQKFKTNKKGETKTNKNYFDFNQSKYKNDWSIII
jgi:hypothetical protein